jgi:uncharacterized membrane protein YphA (DoxX/SURF4 family)
MDDSIAHPSVSAPLPASSVEVAPWKSIISTASGVLLGMLFIVSGGWKITDPFAWEARVVQMQLPASLAMLITLFVGVSELFGGVLLLVPRVRRWGAWITGALLVGFMIFFAVYYDVLRGEDCSCFPWLKRTVGPGFFIGDAAMLAAAFLAWRWAPRAHGVRIASMVLGAVLVFAGASYGVAVFEQSGLQAPASVTVEGKPFPLRDGKVFLYFFDPECAHCFFAAQQMSGYRWKDVKLLTAPTRQERFAGQFLTDTGLKAPLTYDVKQLREKFTFTDPPYGVLLEDGRQLAAVIQFEDQEPAATLKKYGFIE